MKDRERRKTKLKELIQKANLTQREVGHMTGLTERAVNDLVRGVSFPRLDRAAALARVLGVSFKRLCEALVIPIDGIPDDMQNPETADDSSRVEGGDNN